MRIIECEVKNEYVIGDGVVVGAAGSHNDVALRLRFSDMWVGTTKSIVWKDAYGENPIVTTLTTDMLERGETETYIVPIPYEPKALSGEMTATLKGVIVSGNVVSSATLSATAKFKVLENEWDDNAEETQDITPTQAQQFQSQVDAIKDDIVNAGLAADAKEAAGAFAAEAKISAGTAGEYALEAEGYASSASSSADSAADLADLAAGSAKASAVSAERSKESADEASALVSDAKEMVQAAEEFEDELRTLAEEAAFYTGEYECEVIPYKHAQDDIISETGKLYIVKYYDMPYGEDPSLISPEVFYRLRIGDGITPLADLPNMSNIQAGAGNGSAILVDPTYDNGDDGLEAPKNVADAQYAVALGKYLKNYGKASAVLGYSNKNHAARAFVAGQGNTVTEGAIGAFVAGFKNTVDAEKSAILGWLNQIYGLYIFNAGVGNNTGAEAKNVNLMGYHLASNYPDIKGQIVMGRFNEEDNDAVIIFGAGTSDTDRKNVFKVMRDGTVELLGTVLTEEELLDLKTHRGEIDALKQELDELKAYVEKQMGDVESALDSTIALCDSYIIGEGEAE